MMRRYTRLALLLVAGLTAYLLVTLLRAPLEAPVGFLITWSTLCAPWTYYRLTESLDPPLSVMRVRDARPPVLTLPVLWTVACAVLPLLCLTNTVVPTAATLPVVLLALLVTVMNGATLIFPVPGSDRWMHLRAEQARAEIEREKAGETDDAPLYDGTRD